MEADKKDDDDASLSLGVTIGSAAKAGRHEIVLDRRHYHQHYQALACTAASARV